MNFNDIFIVFSETSHIIYNIYIYANHIHAATCETLTSGRACMEDDTGSALSSRA